VDRKTDVYRKQLQLIKLRKLSVKVYHDQGCFPVVLILVSMHLLVVLVLVLVLQKGLVYISRSSQNFFRTNILKDTAQDNVKS